MTILGSALKYIAIASCRLYSFICFNDIHARNTQVNFLWPAYIFVTVYHHATKN